MYAVVYIVIRQLIRLCCRLLTVFGALFLSGWTLFEVAQGASALWLAIPLVLLATIVWWAQQP